METPSDRHESATRFSRTYPEGLRQGESAALEELRRSRAPQEARMPFKALGVAAEAPAARPPIGLALSGGGIRSATFCLGVLQALAQQKLLRRIDFMSTVSGGGYAGGFLGSLFARKAAPSACRVDEVEATLADARSAPLRWLRENGRYLAPRGGGDYLYALATQVRNWLALHYVFGLALLVPLLAMVTLRAMLWNAWPQWPQLEETLFPWLNGALWWSPWWILPAIWAALVAVPLGWAYWLTQTQAAADSCRCNWPFWASLLVIGLALFASGAAATDAQALWSALLPPWRLSLRLVTTWLALVGVLALLGWQFARAQGANPAGSQIDSLSRETLTQWLTGALGMLIALALLALVDTLGQTAYLWIVDVRMRSHHALTVGGVLAALVALLRRFGPVLKEAGGVKLRMPLNVLALAAGLVLLMLVMMGWSVVSHALLWQGERPEAAWCAAPRLDTAAVCAAAMPGPPALPLAPSAYPLASAFGLILLLALMTGRTLSFINLSTMAQFYAKRLTRAYLGASNQKREQAQSSALLSVREPDADDDIEWAAYHPEKNGGPIHLVNVTINETVSGRSNLEQRDRKGLPMAIGPYGLSVGAKHHLLWSEEVARKAAEATGERDGYAIFPRDGLPIPSEPMTLGHWVAISGAAVSTGMGHGTSLGFSLLLALANLRLGHWWDSGVDPERRRTDRVPPGTLRSLGEGFARIAPTLAYLFDELLARFRGPARRHWYLTDGGHFENTAAYELIRRRLPFIIVCDDGQDARYHLGDLGNLVRSVRTDFGAEIHFLDADELDRKLGAGSPLRRLIGTPADLRPEPQDKSDDAPRFAKRHAALASIHYAEPEPGDGNLAREGLMLVIKPTLTGDEPLDVQHYAREHADFPQQSTGDQFFDEAQWESYRKLGEHIGAQLFATPALPGQWSPRGAMDA